jgi:phage baseplate assembly protein W
MPFKNKEITSQGSPNHRLQKQSQFYKGFSTVNMASKSPRLFDFSLIKQDLLNHFSTRKGSRLMNPSFGTIIWDLIMEPLTGETRELLTNDITTICNFDPRVYPTQIKVTEYDKGFLVELTLVLKNTDQSENLRLVFDQKIGLSVQ